MDRIRLPLQWELGRSTNADLAPDQWIPAAVPGAVQLDWARAHGLPDYRIGANVRQWEGLEDFYWTYRTRLENLPALGADEQLFLVLGGVDYACEVWVEDRCVASGEGLETPVEVNLTSLRRAGLLIEVRFRPAPKSRPAPEDRSQADHSCKPAVAYGWDFHPRLIPLGLWKDAFLEVRSAIYFADRPEVVYQLDESCRRATGHLAVSLSEPAEEGLCLCWSLVSADGATLVTKELKVKPGLSELSVPFEVDLQPEQLWWPHDQGLPVLHRSEVQLISKIRQARLDRDERAVGFRRVRLVMAPGEWEQPADFPKSRSRPPVTLEINGRAIFAKGSNWVCPDVFPGTLTPERYHELLELAHAANFNFLRVWGGASAPHDCFYERCAELGMLVWQEFPLACNCYPDDPDYLAVLDRESRSLIRRLRGSASLAMWCGGNELFNAWSKMTDQSLPLRLLNRNTYELDPLRPFLPTAPIDGMGHGHYTFLDPATGKEVWKLFQESNCTAYSEFGSPGPASVQTLERILPEAERWPPRRGTAWEIHHAFGSWLPSSWLHLEDLERYFGPIECLERLVEHGQFLQAVSFQGLFEEARRQKPTCSMALNWCLTEPWPCAANNSLISWPAEPKPALALVGQSCRPTLTSARIPRLSWVPGDSFEAELWLLNDAPVEHASVKVHAWIEIDGVRQLLLSWQTPALQPNVNARGPRVQSLLPPFDGDRFSLHLDVEEAPEWNSSYQLLRARPEAAPPSPWSEDEKPRLNF